MPTGYPEGSTMTDIALLPSTEAALPALIAAAGGSRRHYSFARRSAWRSRMCTRRTAGYGCGCARRAANGHATPCHHNVEEYLIGYLAGAGLRVDPKGPLFRTIGRGTGARTRTVLPQANAYAMIGRRAAAAGIATKLGNHSFRATGITAYLKIVI